MNIVAIVQARMKSTRLPGKVTMPLAGTPLLARMLERLLAANGPTEVVVATTIDPADDEIVRVASAMGVRSFRGHATDLLDRHFAAGSAFGADVIVKVPSDCPLIDPVIVDRVIWRYRMAGRSADYVSNLHPTTYPDGNDVEVMPMAVLEAAWREAVEEHEREHTTPFIWERPERFRIENVTWEAGLDYSQSHRWTIDYIEDFRLISTIYDVLHMRKGPLFSLYDILDLLRERPEIAAINAVHAGKSWYRDHLAGRPATPDRARA